MTVAEDQANQEPTGGDRVLGEMITWLHADGHVYELLEPAGTITLPSGTSVTSAPVSATAPEVLDWRTERIRTADWRHETVTVPVQLRTPGVTPPSSAVVAAQLEARRDEREPPATVAGGQGGWFALGCVDSAGTPLLQVTALGAGCRVPDWVEAALPGLISDGSWDLSAAEQHLQRGRPDPSMSEELRVAAAAHLVDRDLLTDAAEDRDWHAEHDAEPWLEDVRAGRVVRAEHRVASAPGRHARWLQVLSERARVLAASSGRAAPRVVFVPWRGLRDSGPFAEAVRQGLQAERGSQYGAAVYVLPPALADVLTRVHPQRGWGRSRTEAHVDGFDLGPAHRCDSAQVYAQVLQTYPPERGGEGEVGYRNDVRGAADAARALTEARAAGGCQFGQAAYQPPVHMSWLWGLRPVLVDRMITPPARRRSGEDSSRGGTGRGGRVARRTSLGLVLPAYRDRRGRLHGQSDCAAPSYRPVAEVSVDLDAEALTHLCSRCHWQVPTAHPLVRLWDDVRATDRILVDAEPADEAARPDDGEEEPRYRRWERRQNWASVLDRCLAGERAIADLLAVWPALSAGYAADRRRVRAVGRRALASLAAETTTTGDVDLAAAVTVTGRQPRPHTEPARLSEGIRLSPKVSAHRVDAHADAAWQAWCREVTSGYSTTLHGVNLHALFGRAGTGRAEVAERLDQWRAVWAEQASGLAGRAAAGGRRTVLLALPGPEHDRTVDRGRYGAVTITPGFGIMQALTLTHYTVVRTPYAALVRVPDLVAEALLTGDLWPLPAADVPDELTDQQIKRLAATWRPGLWPPALLHHRRSASEIQAVEPTLMLGYRRPPRTAARRRAQPTAMRLGNSPDMAGLPWPGGATVRAYAGAEGIHGALHGQPRCARFRATVATDLPATELGNVRMCPRCRFDIPPAMMAVVAQQRARAEAVASATGLIAELGEVTAARPTDGLNTVLRGLALRDGIIALTDASPTQAGTDRAPSDTPIGLQAAIEAALAAALPDGDEVTSWCRPSPPDAPTRLVAVSRDHVEAAEPGDETAGRRWALLRVLARVAGSVTGPLVLKVPLPAAEWLCAGEKPVGVDLGPAAGTPPEPDVLDAFLTRWDADGGWAPGHLSEVTQRLAGRSQPAGGDAAEDREPRLAPAEVDESSRAGFPRGVTFQDFASLLATPAAPAASPSKRRTRPVHPTPKTQPQTARPPARPAPPAAGPRPRCSETRTDGKPCRGYPVSGSTMCLYHFEMASEDDDVSGQP